MLKLNQNLQDDGNKICKIPQKRPALLKVITATQN